MPTTLALLFLALCGNERCVHRPERSRPTQIKSAANVVLVNYSYDGLGRRIVADFDPNTPAIRRTIHYYYDGATIVEERDGSDTRLR